MNRENEAQSGYRWYEDPMDMPTPTVEVSIPMTSSIPEVAFVLELGRNMQAFGASVSTLENALGRVSEHLGLEGAVFATPTGFLASLRKEGHHSKTYLMRGDAGWSSLDKLAEVETLVDLVLADRLGIEEARQHLSALLVRPAGFGFWIKVSAHAMAAMGMANIFGGGWREVLLGAVVGLLVGIAVHFTQKRRTLARLAPLMGGMVSSLAGGVIGHWVPSVSYPILVLGGIIGLLPGLGLLVAMQELGTGNLVSGTARMAGTGLVFVLLAFGVGLGQQLGASWLPAIPADPRALPFWTVGPAIALVAMSFLIIFQGRLADYGWTLGASALAWGTAHLAAHVLGPVAGAGIAALALGSACNHYARLSRRPGAVLLLPSLMLILPGSLGVRSLTMMMQKQTLEGLQAGFQSMSVTVALMLGLLMANAMVSRRTF
jgi:uncharacterized membrane protein YjjP (DUF1212 family)